MLDLTGAFQPWLGVFETLRVMEGVPLFVEEHRAELGRAAVALGLEIDEAKLHEAPPKKSGRWRWIVTARKTETLFTEEPEWTGESMTLGVASVRVGSHNWDARFKTLSYLSHAQARRSVTTDEAVILNERGDVASGAHSNIFWRRGKELFTPAHTTGCRCGVVRRFVLNRRTVLEEPLALSELLAADEIFLTNSLKGIVPVSAIEGNPRADFAMAEALRLEYAEAVQEQVTRAA